MERNSNISINKRKLTLIIVGAVVVGVLGMFLFDKLVGGKQDLYGFTKDSSVQKRFRDGGPTSKPSSENYSTLYYNYLQLKEPDPVNFTKRYVGGAYYTINELENYFAVIKADNPSIDPRTIRVYFCPSIYPPNTTNPFNGVRVDDKIATCMVFMKSPYNFISGGRPSINGNPNCLGAYNWGDLEP